MPANEDEQKKPQQLTDPQVTHNDLIKEELMKANSELQQFVYLASHDLKEPLRTVINYSQLLKDELKGVQSPKAEKYLQYIVEGGSRMMRLIDDLLEYSKFESMDQRVVPCNSNQALKSALFNLASMIQESGARITHDELPVVMAEANQLTRIFQNLIGNSIKYRGKEVPEIIIRKEEHPIGWLLSVKDNGIGFDPKFSERIFAIFQRLHPQDKYSGTGIGLAICKKAVTRYGGQIWADSKPGEGATFFFTLKKPEL